MIDLYPKAYKEVYVILQHMSKEDVKKIPTDILQTVENNMDKEYDFNIENNSIENKEILKESKALLAILYKNYWATNEQRARIIAKEKYDINQVEKEKMQRYSPNNIFKKHNNLDTKKVEIVEYKESIIRKIINKIKALFHTRKKFKK